MNREMAGPLGETKRDRVSAIKEVFDLAKSFIGLATALGLLAGGAIMFTYAKSEGFSFLEMAQNAPVGVLAISLLFASYGIILAFVLLGSMHAPYILFRCVWTSPSKVEGFC